MKAIKKVWNIYAVLSAISILLTVLFVSIQKSLPAIVCAASGAMSIFLLYRQNSLLNSVCLICDNRILTVPSSIITKDNCTSEKIMEKTVLSTFGLLLGNKVYQWGCEGIRGIRLQNVRMDREHIYLTFGVDDKKISVELLHGMADRQSVMEFKQRIWYETGVQTEVNDW
mgnify:CR=1 FL=1